MNIRHYLRMARWARKPPSQQRIKLVVAVIGICIVLVLLERIFGWPDWLTPNYTPRGRILR